MFFKYENKFEFLNFSVIRFLQLRLRIIKLARKGIVSNSKDGYFRFSLINMAMNLMVMDQPEILSVAIKD